MSKERIGAELDGMFSGARPVGSLRLLHNFDLFRVILALPAVREGYDGAAAAAALMPSDKTIVSGDLQQQTQIMDVGAQSADDAAVVWAHGMATVEAVNM